MLNFEAKRVRPRWALPVRLASAASVSAYVHCAYRIRGWGELPSFSEPALVISNHQIDLDLMAIISTMACRGGWRSPFFSVAAKLLFEPGFFAIRVPWSASLLRNANLGALFGGMGLLPIENEIRARSAARWAYAVQRRHGVLPLEEVFSASAIERHALAGLRTSDLFTRRHFEVGRRVLKLSDLLPEHRREQFEITARGIEEDLARIEDRLRRGATFYVTPEGEYTRDGAMLRFRGIWNRLAPLAEKVYLAGISYDPFVGRRFSQLYRVVLLSDPERVEAELKMARPVTTSAMLCLWCSRVETAFSAAQAQEGVARLCRSLPPRLFVDPEFGRNSARLVTEGLLRMERFGVLKRDGKKYRLSGTHHHPQFPGVQDIIAFQRRFLEETIAAAAPKRAITGETQAPAPSLELPRA